MTIKRFISYSFVSLIAALFMGVLFGAPAHAVEPKAYWDGSGKIVIKHPFFSQDRLPGDDMKSMDNSATFVLDKESRYPFRFVSEGMQITIEDGGASCTYTSLSFNLDPKNDGTFRVETHYNYEGGFTQGVGGVVVAAASINAGPLVSMFGLMDPCEKAFVGRTGNDSLFNKVEAATEGLRSPFTVRGEMGATAERTSFRETLKNSKDNEMNRFTHRFCGSSIRVSSWQSAQDCARTAKDAYGIIWDYCERYAINLYNQNERVDSFQSCIEEKSGVNIHASSMNNSLLNVIDYDGGESCSIRYIGWIICPLSRFMASVTDAAFNGISEFFVIRPLGRGEQAGDALYRAWSLINTIANVIFIIAFMVVIFSQLTGRGLSNLGIKRMLPKIILTAILVNASYYICIVAVDLSNIVGSSLKDVITAIGPKTFTDPPSWKSEVENLLVFGATAVGGAFILLTASIVAMLPLLVGSLLSLLVAVIMLVARYALILILIVLAPVAIACTLLPNTQKWYNQWFKLFTSLLALFPLIAIVFGGSQVAGFLVLNSSLSRSTGDITLQLFGLAIMALPLAITPLLMRLSGGVLNRFGGVVSNQGFFSGTKKRTADFVKRRDNARDVKALTHIGENKRRGLSGLRDTVRRREYMRGATQDLHKSELSKSQSGFASQYAADPKTSTYEKAKAATLNYIDPDRGYTPQTKSQKDLSKGGVDAHSASASELAAKVKINTENVKAAKAGPTIQNALAQDQSTTNMDNMVDLATNSNDAAIRQAAIEIVMEQGNGSDIDTVVKSVSTMDTHQKHAVAQGVSSSNAKRQAAYYDHPDIKRTIMTSNPTQTVNSSNFQEKVVAPWLNSGDFNERNIGTMHESSLQEVRSTLANASSTGVSAATTSEVSRLAGLAKDNPSVQQDGAGSTAQRVAQLDNIANGRYN